MLCCLQKAGKKQKNQRCHVLSKYYLQLMQSLSLAVHEWLYIYYILNQEHTVLWMFITCLNPDYMTIRKNWQWNNLLFDKVLNMSSFSIIWLFECNLHLVLASTKKYSRYDKYFRLSYILFFFGLKNDILIV